MDKSNNNQNKLTRRQIERLSLLRHYFDDATAHDILGYIEPRGMNCWSAIEQKINAFNYRSYIEREYDEYLYEEFSNNKVYTFRDIISKVTKARAELRLPSYVDRIKLHCERDFQRLFIIERAYEQQEDSNRHIGYKTKFKLRPEQR